MSKKNINCPSVNDIEETDPAILSDSFNKFFTTLTQKIESKLVPTNKNYTDYLTNPSKKTFFLRLQLLTKQKTIKKLSVGKSPGPAKLL